MPDTGFGRRQHVIFMRSPSVFPCCLNDCCIVASKSTTAARLESVVLHQQQFLILALFPPLRLLLPFRRLSRRFHSSGIAGCLVACHVRFTVYHPDGALPAYPVTLLVEQLPVFFRAYILVQIYFSLALANMQSTLCISANKTGEVPFPAHYLFPFR